VRIAINAWFLNQPGTGSGQYLHGLLDSLPGLAPEDEFLLVSPAPEPDLSPFQLRPEVWPVPPWITGSSVGKVLFEQVLFPRACRRWGADVAHVPYWGSPLLPTVPTVVTIHDVIPLRLPAYRGGPLVRLYTRLVSASARRTAAIITDSRASKKDIEGFLDVPPPGVHCIYLAPVGEFQPEPLARDEAIREHYGLSGRYVLYLAGHDVRKNVAALVEAFATVWEADADVTLVLGGRLPARNADPFYDPRPLISALGIEQDVRLLGWVEEAHKPALYRGAACAAFLSRYEGFGLPILEALACGTPLVASNAASLPELVGDAGFVLDPDDVTGIAGALLACLVDEPLAAELGRRGPEQAARFTWSQTARQTLVVYRAAAGGQGPEGGTSCAS
jgi:glycosyltransferase involved in cell wall biosynthesis